jgi:hypothetical protein
MFGRAARGVPVIRASTSHLRNAVTAAGVSSALAMLAFAADANAVTLNPRGLGQVLIYPYYTVNAGFGTLLSVVNTTPNGKALKLRFHEGRNGRSVFDLNVYLSPFDVWVAQVYSSGDENSGASIATNDHSCVMPAFLLPVDPGSGPPRANFSDASFSGANADGGPVGAARTREGFFDVIEMGEVTDAAQHTLTAITHDASGAPASCEQIHAAWSAPGGYWGQNAQTDLAPPGGGLYGAESIINVAEGLMYTIDATAIDGFSNVIQHTGPGDAAPDLDTASANASASFSAFVAVDDRSIEAQFAKPEDAVSALLMADALYNEYVVDPGLAAATDWIVTLPTKRFYTDPQRTGNTARKPFDVPFSSVSGGASCSPVGGNAFDREELTISSGIVFPGIPPWPNLALCFNTNPLTFAGSGSVLGSQLPFDIGMYSNRVDVSFVEFKSGHFMLWPTLDPRGDLRANGVLTSSNGIALSGLPALGFAVSNYVNGNVTPGTLANYSEATPHRSTVRCSKPAEPQSDCR